jgi:hypothetical protein
MASDVTASVSGIDLKPIGITISYGVNAIPECLVEIDAADSTSLALLQNPDKYKRQNVCTISFSVNDKITGFTNEIKFEGLFDGISISQSMGHISYAAVFKGNAQLLLEADTTLPGLSPYGMDPFHMVNTIGFNGIAADDTSSLQNYLNGIPFKGQSIAELYKALVIATLNYQISGDALSNLVPSPDENSDFSTLIDVLENEGRQAKLTACQSLIENLNIDALSQLKALTDCGSYGTGGGVVESFTHGPRVLWENMVDFYGDLGCLLIVGNSQIFVVPDNGFLTMDVPKPGTGQHSSTPNLVYPADYNDYSYNESGYKDVGYVALVTQKVPMLGSFATNSCYQGAYPKKNAHSKSPGVALLVVEVSPLLFETACASIYLPGAAPNSIDNQVKKPTNVAPGKKVESMSTPVGRATLTEEQIAEAANDAYNGKVKQMGDTYAQIKYYQARYGDRGGTILSSFSNSWCPGTVGKMYTKYPSNWIAFMVQRVTHRISLSPPNSGTATTTISFNCGRSGLKIDSVDQDPIYQYSYGDALGVQNQFIQDIT